MVIILFENYKLKIKKLKESDVSSSEKKDKMSTRKSLKTAVSKVQNEQQNIT